MRPSPTTSRACRAPKRHQVGDHRARDEKAGLRVRLFRALGRGGSRVVKPVLREDFGREGGRPGAETAKAGKRGDREVLGHAQEFLTALGRPLGLRPEAQRVAHAEINGVINNLRNLRSQDSNNRELADDLIEQQRKQQELPGRSPSRARTPGWTSLTPCPPTTGGTWRGPEEGQAVRGGDLAGFRDARTCWSGPHFLMYASVKSSGKEKR